MVRRLILTAAGLVLALSICAMAGDNGVASAAAKKEFRFDVREAERTATVEKNLSHEIDLWHDSALKRNGKRMRAHEKRIFDMIQDDLQARDRLIYRYENEAAGSVKNVVQEPGTVSAAPAVEKRQAVNDIKDLRKARQLLKAKELLFDSIKRTDTFSNRYRLLGDYLEIVRRESRLNTVELAEDGHELNKESFE
ncbi:MAG TPA: hypothetical protein VHP63_08495 [candidate division Zixibacteria bacterium]|nr:hypothetical protein [candidate division Zixibacteria bacterium]